MKRILFLAVALGVIIFDVITKWLIIRHLPYHGDPVIVVPGFLQIVHVHNTGAAFGLGANSSSPLVPLLLNTGAIAVFVLVAIYAFRSASTDLALQSGLHLILGGAIGNLIDRFRFGYVIDFVDVWVTAGGREYHWPAFNVADSAICVGIALLFLDMMRKPATATVHT